MKKPNDTAIVFSIKDILPQLKTRKFNSFIGFAVFYREKIFTINLGKRQVLVLTGSAKNDA